MSQLNMMKLPKVTAYVAAYCLLSSYACQQAFSQPGQLIAARHASVGANSTVIENAHIRFAISPSGGEYAILDKRTGVVWRSNPFEARFGVATLIEGGVKSEVSLTGGEVQHSGDGLELMFHPLQSKPNMWVQISILLLAGGDTIEFRYEASPNILIQDLRLLDNAMWVATKDKGYIVVPARMGQLIPADSHREFTQSFLTYDNEGCDMQMLGVVKGGSAALVYWGSPYVEAEVRSVIPRKGTLANTQVLAPSLTLQKSAAALRIRLLGSGNYVTIAKAYRDIAVQRGWVVPWSDKLRAHPDRAKLFGAADFRLGKLLDRQMNKESTQELSSRVNWTFDEAAEVARHLKDDLKLDRVLFVVGGWIRRGYDNQHPDILPAAPELGGSAGLRTLSAKVQQLGYLFSPHDNYQDIYRDSPSWDPGLVMKNPDGSLAVGGDWSGGRAYLICSKKGLELAERSQNLAAVKDLTQANAYFIDTTFAAPLMECFDPTHPLTRQDDMKWKQDLADYARGLFGVFGSEDGDEWAIPHSDYFEGLLGVHGQYFYDTGFEQKFGGITIPLFELVYRDTIAMYAKYPYDLAHSSNFVLYHISLGRPLIYDGIPPHLYWKEKTGEEKKRPAVGPDPALFTRADKGWAEGLHPLDRFVKNTYEILSPLNEITAQMEMTNHAFLTPDRTVQLSVFGKGPDSVAVLVNSGTRDFRHTLSTGQVVTLPPNGFVVESPTFVAFHARNWNGLSYSDPPFFTLRSLDGKPLDRSGLIRVFHGFGDPRLRIGHTTSVVQKESRISSELRGQKLQDVSAREATMGINRSPVRPQMVRGTTISPTALTTRHRQSYPGVEKAPCNCSILDRGELLPNPTGLSYF